MFVYRCVCVNVCVCVCVCVCCFFQTFLIQVRAGFAHMSLQGHFCACPKMWAASGKKVFETSDEEKCERESRSIGSAKEESESPTFGR